MNRNDTTDRTGLDELLLELLDADDPVAEMATRGIDGATEKCRELRRFMGAYAALAWGEPERAPRGAVKEGLLAAVAQAPGAGRVPSVAAVVADAPEADEVADVRAGPAPGRRQGWLLSLAAALAALAIGLAGYAGWLWSRVESQQQVIASLRGQLQQRAEIQGRIGNLRDELGRLESRLELVSSQGVEICPLQPVGDHPLARQARGVLFVAADHQHWYLTLEGLQEAPPGHVYQLWFVTEEGAAVSGGTFASRPGERLELSSADMPAGTRAVAVTLEPDGGTDRPTGPQLLWGDEAMVVS